MNCRYNPQITSGGNKFRGGDGDDGGLEVAEKTLVSILLR